MSTAWEKRQYISDLKDPTSAQRQKRYRDGKRNDRNATVTSRLPEADTDTDTDTELKTKAESRVVTQAKYLSPSPKPKKQSSQIPSDFYPNENGIIYAKAKNVSIENALDSFRNWHESKGTMMKDWQAAWRTWCDKSLEFGNTKQSIVKSQPFQHLNVL